MKRFLVTVGFALLAFPALAGTASGVPGTIDVTVVQDPTNPTNPGVPTVGNVTAGTADTGAPVKTGCVYNSTRPTYATGQRADCQSDSRGNGNVVLRAADSPTAVGVAAPSGSALSAPNSLQVEAFEYNWNGAQLDVNRNIAGYIAQGVGGGSAGISATAGVNPGVTETCSSGNVANATVACTLATAASRTTFISGFMMTASGATSGLAVNCTVTGIITGTQTFTFVYPAGVLVAATPLAVTFTNPIPASAANTAIVVSCPASGTGGTNAAMNAWGSLL